MKIYITNLGLILLFSTLLFATCKSKHIKNINKEKINYKIISKGNHSPYTKAYYKIITDKKTLSDIYSRINSFSSKKKQLPIIDFKQHSIIALFMGQQGTGGHSINIDSIIYNTKEYVVYITEKHPEGIASAVLTEPYLIAQTKALIEPVVFIKNE